MRCTDTTTPAASMGLQNGPSSSMQRPSTRHTTNDSKIERIRFCLIQHIHLTSHQPTTTSSSIKQLSVGKTLTQPAGSRKSSHALIKSQSMDFYAKKNQTFLVDKNVLIVMVPILLTKMFKIHSLKS